MNNKKLTEVEIIEEAEEINVSSLTTSVKQFGEFSDQNRRHRRKMEVKKKKNS